MPSVSMPDALLTVLACACTPGKMPSVKAAPTVAIEIIIFLYTTPLNIICLF